ncbi:MAG TPA: CPBP family glutamic-type intramembrane protease [Methanomicrobiales archaeon]|nr:CPBP family glutamic-type intramembrane protease [Methanomicrobiales archaeon]
MFDRLSLSTKILLLLDGILAILTGIYVLSPQYPISPAQPFPAPLPVLAVVSAVGIFILYGALAFIGLKLARRLGLPEIWDAEVSNRDRFLAPAIRGVGIGLFFIAADLLFRNFNSLGAIIHPPFPSSLIASATAGIGEEMIFRLFLISLGTWIVSTKILKGERQDQVFWAVAVFSALLFGFSHLPALMILFGLPSFQQVPPVFLAEVLLLNGVLSLAAASFFKKSGFLAAVGVHFWADVVWHVLFGLL